MPAFATVLAVVAILYFAKDVLLPLAIAVLLTFALAPISSRLRKLGLPRIIAVVTTVVLAFFILILFGLIVAWQVAEVAQDLPTYQGNIIGKIRALQESGTDNGIVRSSKASGEKSTMPGRISLLQVRPRDRDSLCSSRYSPRAARLKRSQVSSARCSARSLHSV
jgi:predicted PurR-regulated permease PerM